MAEDKKDGVIGQATLPQPGGSPPIVPYATLQTSPLSTFPSRQELIGFAVAMVLMSLALYGVALCCQAVAEALKYYVAVVPGSLRVPLRWNILVIGLAVGIGAACMVAGLVRRQGGRFLVAGVLAGMWASFVAWFLNGLRFH